MSERLAGQVSDITERLGIVLLCVGVMTLWMIKCRKCLGLLSQRIERCCLGRLVALWMRGWITGAPRDEEFN